jgi:hypothetical protein
MTDIVFDSEEEREFHAWCVEAVEVGMVKEFIYHPETYKLADRATFIERSTKKGKEVYAEKFLMHPHEYTPDFRVVFTSRGGLDIAMKEVIPVGLFAEKNEIIVDVKGTFDRFHDAKQFAINQKWVFAKYGVYIHKIIPEKWFRKLWVPQEAMITPKKKELKKKYIGFATKDSFSYK